MTKIEMGLAATAVIHGGGDIRVRLAVTEYHGPKALRQMFLEETLSNQDARRALIDLRDLADRAIQRHWPEDRPAGRHKKEE